MTAIDTRRAAAYRPQVRQFCQPLFAVTELARVGGKALTLGRLLRAGFPVPDGFVLTTVALDALLEHHALDACVGDLPLPDCVREQLLAAAAPLLADGPVVVRSSAVGEDGRTESFAGQLDSVLHVSDGEELERAVTTVWASLWSDRVSFYAKARGITTRGMGVVVQRQVDALAAGVLFTATTGRDMLVEFAPGLGDALVAGQVDPGRLAVDRTTGAVRVLSANDAFTLDERHVAELRTLGLMLENELDGPQDVEWALSQNGALLVVQSRPITAPVTIPSAESHTLPLGAVPFASRPTVSWSNANVNENFPRPISPLLYSIASAGYTHYFRNLAVAFGVSRARVQAMEPSFQQIIGVHGARMYYNLTSIHSVLRLAPFGAALTASFDTFVGADGNGVASHAVTRRSRVAQLAEVAVIVAKAAGSFFRLGKRIARFERTVDDFAARTSPSALARMTLGDLRRSLGEFVEIRCHKWLDASLADAASMLCYGALERLLKNEGVSHTALLKAIPDVVSGEPVLRLWDLSRMIRADSALDELVATLDAAGALTAIRTDARFADFRAAFDAYVDEWGFRCSEELMLTTPSFQENHRPLVDMLRAYARIDGDSPRDALRQQAAERECETRRMRSALRPGRSAVLGVLLPRTHAAIRYRERARLKQALLYSRCRRIALAIGAELVAREVIADRDDVFFLTHQELAELTGGSAMLPGAVRAIVEARKTEHARLSATTPPDAFTLGEGEYLGAGVAATTTPSIGALAGTSACSGTTTGRATVLGAVTESARLSRGDVLVTKQTDPGWAPVFFLISGLVIERGGMLSHGAIIAREFGIPCVVGVKNAMARIPDGATVTVDGDAGAVHVES